MGQLSQIQILWQFLSSSVDTLPVHVSPTMENKSNIETISHALPSGTTLKLATVKLRKLTDIDIDLWTIPKPVAPEKGQLKPVRVILDKHNVSNSDEGTLGMKHGKNKDKIKLNGNLRLLTHKLPEDLPDQNQCHRNSVAGSLAPKKSKLG